MEMLWALPIHVTFILFFHGAGLVFAFDAVMRGRSPQGVIAWVLCLVMIPYITVPIYLIFGPQRFYGYKIKIEKARSEFQDQIELALGPLLEMRAQLSKEYADDQKFLESLCQWPVTDGNSVELLATGEQFFETLFAQMKQAKTYILLEYYILRGDAVGQKILSIMRERLAAGVRIYVLYDQIGSINLAGRFVRELRHAGVYVQAFRTNLDLIHRLRLNFRNHRKIAVFDGRFALVGGHNLGAEYAGSSKRFGEWRDTSVLVSGPVVQSLQFIFGQDWYWANGEVPQLEWKPQSSSRIKSIAIPTGPTDTDHACSLLILDLISMAQRRIWMSSPYLVPDDAICSALVLAARRGVDVSIILPGVSDQLLMMLATASYAHQFTESKIKIFRFEPGFCHQKVILVDDEISSIGTVNLDNRSLRLNFEVSLVTFDIGFARKVEKMLEADFARCRLVDHAESNIMSFAKKVLVQVVRLASPIL